MLNERRDNNKQGFIFDKKVNVQTFIYSVIILITVVAGYIRTQDKVDRIQENQANYTIFQTSIEDKYVTKEQLEYIVVERIDRLEATLERRLRELEQKLEAQLQRIEEKLDK